MADISPSELSKMKRAIVVAPAGCGKTQLIADSVACCSCGRQLILTHTHAGVKSILDKLRMRNVVSKRYRVETIDGFARKYAQSYPKTSSIDLLENDYPKILNGAVQVLSTKFCKKVISETYAGVYVDEYQDCSPHQHQLISIIASFLPCRALGDPLQGIFDFGSNKIVNWGTEVYPLFQDAFELSTPWRWKNTGSDEFGEWLLSIRDNINNCDPIDLSKVCKNVVWMSRSRDKQKYRQSVVNICKYTKLSGSIVGIHNIEPQQHSFAKSLGGSYNSMEKLECPDLFKFTDQIGLKGKARVIGILDFCSECMSNTSTLSTVRSNIEKERYKSSLKKHSEIYQLFVQIVSNNDLCLVLSALDNIKQIKDCHISRKELWHYMIVTLKEHIKVKNQSDASLSDTAKLILNRERLYGRRIYSRCISRTLLIKGLEFDHAILLDADELTKRPKELYVALTRGSKTLTIFSSSSRLALI